MNNEIANLYEKIEKMRPFLNGRGKEVAEIAGLEYSTYLYYMRGIGKSPAKLKAIIRAGKIVVNQIQAEMSEI